MAKSIPKQQGAKTFNHVEFVSVRKRIHNDEITLIKTYNRKNFNSIVACISDIA